MSNEDPELRKLLDSLATKADMEFWMIIIPVISVSVAIIIFVAWRLLAR